VEPAPRPCPSRRETRRGDGPRVQPGFPSDSALALALPAQGAPGVVADLVPATNDRKSGRRPVGSAGGCQAD
jgi:hypothetical protein